VKWFRPAAEQDHGAAKFNLGVCYLYGQGVTKDEVEAYKWISLSAAQGHSDAKKALPTVEGGLTAGQISKAQQLVREVKPHKSAEEGGFDSRKFRLIDFDRVRRKALRQLNLKSLSRIWPLNPTFLALPCFSGMMKPNDGTPAPAIFPGCG